MLFVGLRSGWGHWKFSKQADFLPALSSSRYQDMARYGWPWHPTMRGRITNISHFYCVANCGKNALSAVRKLCKSSAVCTSIHCSLRTSPVNSERGEIQKYKNTQVHWYTNTLIYKYRKYMIHKYTLHSNWGHHQSILCGGKLIGGLTHANAMPCGVLSH